MAPNMTELTPELLLAVPYLLIGTVDQICQDLLTRREQYGISYVTVFEKNMEHLAPVVAGLAGK